MLSRLSGGGRSGTIDGMTGVAFTTFETRVDTIVRLAQQAETLGLDRVQVAEAWSHDATIVLAEIAAQTSRIEDSPWRLPTARTISWLLGLGDFLDFQQQLEQVHDDVHVWVGGTMAEIPFAAYDPLFFAHHAMVDRVWRLWQLRHPTAGMPPGVELKPVL